MTLSAREAYEALADKATKQAEIIHAAKREAVERCIAIVARFEIRGPVEDLRAYLAALPAADSRARAQWDDKGLPEPLRYPSTPPVSRPREDAVAWLYRKAGGEWSDVTNDKEIAADRENDGFELMPLYARATPAAVAPDERDAGYTEAAITVACRLAHITYEENDALIRHLRSFDLARAQ